MRTVVICDDDSAVLKELKAYVEQCAVEPVQVKTFTRPDKAEEYIQARVKVDVLLLDIVLENEDGILMAKKIQRSRPDIRIIFITGYLEQAKRIFHAGPAYFLVKPIRPEHLKQVLENVIQKIREDENSFLTLQTKTGIEKINIRDIYYVESRIRVLSIHTRTDRETVYMKMDDFINQLPDTFLRVHKSFLVNMDKICHFSSEGVVLENDERIPISRARYKEAKVRFLGYCGEELMG